MNEISFLDFAGLSKEEKYKKILPIVDALFEGEYNRIANLSNLVSVLKYSFDYYLWVGFYFLDTEKKTELVVGPYQGKIACTRLRLGKGVCSAAVEKKETIVVDDVNSFPGHIACDSDSKSEIVIPVVKDNEVVAVLDVDSEKISAFDSIDKKYLEQLIKNITYIF